MGICLILSMNNNRFRTVGRPKKCRFVKTSPLYTYFKPRGISLTNLDEVYVTVDEIEAIRLADYEGLYHVKAAEIMDISRQTFGRILASAHKKIGEGLIKGKAIRIKGGNYNTNKF
ncbi:DUF134 domain-containing protein [Candidatus Neomarinimicrobiota bacterium]